MCYALANKKAMVKGNSTCVTLDAILIVNRIDASIRTFQTVCRVSINIQQIYMDNNNKNVNFHLIELIVAFKLFDVVKRNSLNTV